MQLSDQLEAMRQEARKAESDREALQRRLEAQSCNARFLEDQFAVVEKERDDLLARDQRSANELLTAAGKLEEMRKRFASKDKVREQNLDEKRTCRRRSLQDKLDTVSCSMSPRPFDYSIDSLGRRTLPELELDFEASHLRESPCRSGRISEQEPCQVKRNIWPFDEGMRSPEPHIPIAGSPASPQSPRRLQGSVRLQEPVVTLFGAVGAAEDTSTSPSRHLAGSQKELVTRLSERVRPQLGAALEVGASKQER